MRVVGHPMSRVRLRYSRRFQTGSSLATKRSLRFLNHSMVAASGTDAAETKGVSFALVFHKDKSAKLTPLAVEYRVAGPRGPHQPTRWFNSLGLAYRVTPSTDKESKCQLSL